MYFTIKQHKTGLICTDSLTGLLVYECTFFNYYVIQLNHGNLIIFSVTYEYSNFTETKNVHKFKFHNMRLCISTFFQTDCNLQENTLNLNLLLKTLYYSYIPFIFAYIFLVVLKALSPKMFIFFYSAFTYMYMHLF